MRPALGRGTDGDNENIVSPFFCVEKNPRVNPVSRRGEGVIGPGAQGKKGRKLSPTLLDSLKEGAQPCCSLDRRGREGERDREGGAEREREGGREGSYPGNQIRK